MPLQNNPGDNRPPPPPRHPKEAEDEESKNATIKTLAIVGAIVVIVLGVWIAVQIVQVVPSAFSSLASLVESIYSDRPKDDVELGLTSEQQVANSGEPFTISWDSVGQSGTHIFSYVCTDGVSVNVRAGDQFFENISCVAGAALPTNTTTAEVSVMSEKQRFIDLEYSVSFTADEEEGPLFSESGMITVVNANIPDGISEADKDEEPQDQSGEDDAKPADAEDEDAVDTTPKPTPQPKPRTISIIPQSDPNGFVDLRATIVATGSIRGNTFVPASVIDADDSAAIQIEVKNIGTKTSGRWDLDIELPGGGELTLDGEQGLKPNERAVLTIEFSADDLDGSESFDGRVDVSGDITISNNAFRGSMRFND